MASLVKILSNLIGYIYSEIASRISPETYFNLAQKIILTIVIFILGYIIAKKLSGFVQERGEETLEDHKLSILSKLTYYGVLIISTIVVLRSVFGTTFGGLFAAAGLTGIVLGLAAQKSMSNLISGIFLFVDRSFEIGDMVEVDGSSGYVREITLFSTRIVTYDNTLVKVPNDRMFSEAVKNNSKFGIRRLDIEVGISYDSDIDKAREIILQILEDEEKILEGPEPEVVVKELGDSAVVLGARPWINPKDRIIQFSLKERIKKALNEAGVEIPFPHKTIYHRAEKDFPVKLSSESIKGSEKSEEIKKDEEFEDKEDED